MHALRRKQLVIFFGDIMSLYIGLVLFLVFWPVTSVSAHIVAFSELFVIWLLVFFLFNLYESEAVNPTPRTIGRLLLAFIVNFFLGILFFYAVPGLGITPKGNLAIVAITAAIVVIVERRLLYHLFRKGFKTLVAFYGDVPEYEPLREKLRDNEYFEFVPEDKNPDILIVPETMPKEELVMLSRYQGEIERVETAYEKLLAKVSLALMNDASALACMERRFTTWTALARTVEITIALLVLIVTLPITALAALAVVIEDRGPVFYSQSRTGKNGTEFMLHKFRSMRTDAEKGGVQWAQMNDSRITRVGRILRKSHIDEIPQMWNIIRGDLALVGPRAERPEFVAVLEREVPYYYVRHIIKPGFTGWAQIKYRYARTVDDSREKFEYDLFYIKNRSLLLDVGIVLKTVQIIFTH
jgi:lipopolysaccharide/colanic/teichoic acid biosynthesis glycosyltransferase